MIGIGNDLVDVPRFRETLERTPGLKEKLYREGERAYAESANDPTERYAVRFAAKEAVMKAMGVGIGDLNFADIEILREETGKPAIALHGGAAQLADLIGVSKWLITMSHTAQTAQAIAVAL